MTIPEDENQARAQAKERLAAARENAFKIRDRGITIASRWRKSQEDNNFRQMLRQIGKGISDATSS